MDLSFLNAEDWADFEHGFPDAHVFLVARGNLREYIALRQKARPTPYERKRLEDLALVFGKTEKSDGMVRG